MPNQIKTNSTCKSHYKYVTVNRVCSFPFCKRVFSDLGKRNTGIFFFKISGANILFEMWHLKVLQI